MEILAVEQYTTKSKYKLTSVTYESSGIKTTVVTGYLARLAVSKHGFVILAVHLTFVIQLFEVP